MHEKKCSCLQSAPLRHWTDFSKFISSAGDLVCIHCQKQANDCLQAKIDTFGVSYLEEFRRKKAEVKRDIVQTVRKLEELSVVRQDLDLQFANFLREVQTQRKAQIKEVKRQKKQLIRLFRKSYEALILLPFPAHLVPQPLPLVPQVIENPQEAASLLSISTANSQVISIDSPAIHYCRNRCLSAPLPGLNEGTAHCVLSGKGDRVICVGGSNSDLCYLLEEQKDLWKVTALQSMKAGRGRFGLVVLEGDVLVIGGWSRGKALKECEKLNVVGNIEESSWKSIADMKHPRYELNPCVYKSEVYVAGGHSLHIEIYTPRSDRFRLISAELRSSCPTISLVFEGQLLILVGEETLRLAADNTVSTDWKRQNYVSWSQSPPLVFEDRLYIVERGSLKVLVLPDGRNRDVEYCAQLLD